MDPLSRRDALKKLGLLGGAALAAGCTPVKILLHAYPERFYTDAGLIHRVLAALADTILPDAGGDAATLARPFYDERFPLQKYRSFLASDLCARARALCGTHRFELLSWRDRARVVEDGLSADATTEKLYAGAIFLAQIAFYGGIYDDDAGCAAIGFDGRYHPRPLAELTYANAEDFLAEEIGLNGNFA